MRKPAFERKIPVNPKYASIQSGIDTGATAKKAAPVLSDQQVSKRRNELFRRIRPAKCFDIIKSIEEGEEVESVYDLVPQTVSTSSSPDDAVSVVSVVASTSMGLSTARDFLLVDLRSPD